MTRKLAAYAAGLLACSSFTVPAFAQDTEMPEMPEAPEADDSVIIVTATRRAQDVQDIPLAVTAVSPQQLDNQGVDSIQEVVSVATSFTASNAQVASGSVVLRIRGIGTTSNNIGFESAVGIFIDGTYQSRPGVALTELVDVERVEVLRGPQGTTFGRNTSAGALNITNKRPDLNEVGGFVNAGYGNFDEISLQGAVNVPIVEDALALRVTGAYRERDGFITLVDETGTPFDDSNDTDQWLVRAQLGFETEGGVRGRIIGDYSKSNSSCCSPIELYQSPLVTGGAYAAVGLGANGGNGQPTVATTPFDNATFREALNDRVASANFAPIVDIDNWGITGEVEFPVGDDADLIFIGGYRKFASNETYDSDFTALDIFNVDLLDLELETITAELRLQGEAFEGKLNYIIGGFYSDEQIDQSVSFSLGSDYDANVGALLFVPHRRRARRGTAPDVERRGQPGRHDEHQPLPAERAELFDLHSQHLRGVRRVRTHARRALFVGGKGRRIHPDGGQQPDLPGDPRRVRRGLHPRRARRASRPARLLRLHRAGRPSAGDPAGTSRSLPAAHLPGRFQRRGADLHDPRRL